MIEGQPVSPGGCESLKSSCAHKALVAETWVFLSGSAPESSWK